MASMLGLTGAGRRNAALGRSRSVSRSFASPMIRVDALSRFSGRPRRHRRVGQSMVNRCALAATSITRSRICVRNSVERACVRERRDSVVGDRQRPAQLVTHRRRKLKLTDIRLPQLLAGAESLSSWLPSIRLQQWILEKRSVRSVAKPRRRLIRQQRIFQHAHYRET